MIEPKPTTKAEAKALGLKRYFTGVPCANGHVSWRTIASSNCMECMKSHNAKHYAKTLKGRRQGELRERVRKNGEAYIERNKDAILARRRARYAERRQEMLDRRREYYKNNYASVLATNAKMRCERMKRTPPWLGPTDLDAINSHYVMAVELSALTGKTWHVDHVVPLQGKRVCGLHVPWNLQVIPANDNLKKGNRIAV